MSTPTSLLPDLRESLIHCSWRRHLAMMASHGLPCSTRWHKDRLEDALYAQLAESGNLEHLVLGLSPAVQEALRALLVAGGALPAQAFQASFGQVRPHRPWRKQVEPVEPWRTPASPVERLWYLGLLYLVPAKPVPGLVQRAYVPADLLEPLRALLLPTDGDQITFLYPRPGTPPDLIWHVALLLSSLVAEPVRLMHGRWLPPRTLTMLAQRIGLDQYAGYRPSRSERNLPYLAFLHHVATAAELVSAADNQQLTITAAGWKWLSASTSERWQTLWRAWMEGTEDAAAFRFPGADLSSFARSLVLAELRRLLPGRFYPLAQLAHQIHLRDAYGHVRGGPDKDPVAGIIAGPLLWFGVIDVGANEAKAGPFLPLPVEPMSRQTVHTLDWTELDTQAPENEPQQEEPELAATAGGDSLEAAVADRSKADDIDTQAISAPANTPGLTDAGQALRLSPLGGWLLGMPDWGPPPATAPAACTRQATDPDLIQASPDTAPVNLAWLATFCEWQPLERPALQQRFKITAERLGLAVAGGLAIDQIVFHLEEALGKPLSRRQTQRLRRWGEAGRLVRVRQVMLVETADSALMGRLRSRKLVRRHLGEALSPTRSAVDPAGFPALVQTLRTLGLYAALPTLEDNQTRRAGRSAAGLPGASLLYMAGLIYQGLGEHVALATPLPGDLLAGMSQELTTLQREAAEHAAKQALEQIKATLRGYLTLPGWQVRDHQQNVLSLLETAISQNQDAILTYWAAGREEQVVRRVTPYWLEQRRQVAYLVGYCHLREAERVFRVDRISACTLLDRQVEEQAPDSQEL